MKHTMKWGVGLATIASLALTACTGSTAEPTSSTTTDAMSEPVTLSLAAWSLDSTPEFQTLADAFHAENPDITIELKEYAAGNDYDTQMIADLAGGVAPDLYILKNLKNFYTYQDGGQLLDVSDVASGYDSNTNGLPFYQVDGKTFAVPYRQDSWYLYYNKDLFDKAGMDYPDGSWTWGDWATKSEALSKALGDGTFGAYEHRWQSTTQGFANAQSAGADILTGKFGYMESYYDTRVAMQENGAEVDFGTSSTNNLSYQGEFGRQNAAMLIMGSWYVASYIAQQQSGDADTFNWGIAPVPQLDSSTVNNPVTFGDPTGIGINPAIDNSKLDAAKKFLAFVGGENAAVALSGIGITPAYSSDTVTAAYFALDGVPADDLSKFTFGHHDTKPENPVSPNTAAIQNILGDMHSAILSGSSSVNDAIAEAETRAANEVLNQ